ncbi:hypothetical protein OQJ46_00340 [Microbulbifer thermotolerans]|uniref:Branched-chain amino acid transport protein (AzlD) n=1 Tax=Microbulbifer thermotolerans TaxID=252514 RepID=A0AB35HYQ9_MICTH|nr:hypothetical protein [Microbulbifer thermotolerans]MCX2778933.1 hypothetical protein [Microbulbifer thermotolerans]MCX2781435.1 hypothetical protein [Microbulbifer thermotolerans]MCX2793818.1 hypothetical protein [Microbulbifer thermotolerans]MCX2802379.1 hypothetical protein [Microbulbifer thermotolerans]MCX2804238.1 hypothetical protein [Microbulbifer thermotolerans]
MEFLILLIILLVVLVLPLKMAAAMMGARNTGVFHCLFALLLAVIIQRFVGGIIPGVTAEYGMLITIPLAAIAYMLVLGTSFLKAILIAIVQGVILIGAVLLLGFAV